MKPLNPQVPFVWPEPRAIEETGTYTHQPPFGELVGASHSVFGVVSALTARGAKVLDRWLSGNPDLTVCLILMVYPTCATRRSDLSQLLNLVGRASGRLSIRLRALERITDRASNALCFFKADSDAVSLAAGPSEDLGLDSHQEGHVNFVFRADPALVEAFKRYFDWMWANSREITANGVALIPDLVIPQGTEEGARLWRVYMNDCINGTLVDDAPNAVAKIDPDTGDVTIRSQDGAELKPPTEKLGLPKLDQLAENMARLYGKGALVSIDKLSRVPPLDAPLDPKLFGDVAELQRGNVTRKVSMRVSIIDEATLKEIEKRRQGMRTLLTKFTFGDK